MLMWTNDCERYKYANGNGDVMLAHGLCVEINSRGFVKDIFFWRWWRYYNKRKRTQYVHPIHTMLAIV